MKTNYIFTSLFLLLFVTGVFAQQGINYKAIIKDGQGAAIVNTAVTVQFTILESGTTSVYQETHTPTTDASGIVIVNIGEGTVVSGVFNDIDWGSNPHYLKTEINTGSGLTDMGTTEFKTVPYALHALNSSGDVTRLNDLSDARTLVNSLYLGKNAGANHGFFLNIHNTGIGYDALLNNVAGANNTAVGYAALKNNTNNSNTAIGSNALSNNTQGSQNVAVGFNALAGLVSGENNIAIGYFAEVPSSTGSNQVQIGNSVITYAGIQVAWTITSDIRWKEDIRNLPYGLDMIMQLKPVDYSRKNDESKTREMGFIAQDVEKLFNTMGYADQGILSKDDKGYLHLRYNDFIVLLTKAVQEQQDIINNLNDKLEKQEKNISALNVELGQLNALESRIKVLEEYQKVTEK